MSAFIVNRDNITLLVMAALNSGPRQGEDFSYWWLNDRHYIRSRDIAEAVRVANVLWRENARSVNYRYENSDHIDEQEAPHYTKGPLVRGVALTYPTKPGPVFKAADCLEYQSCERPDWEQSEAFAILQAIRRRMQRAVEGYEDAAWDFTYPKDRVADQANVVRLF